MAKYVKTEDGYQEIEELNSNKMDKNNPVGTGSFSMGRKVGSVIGKSSHAEGFSTTASGDYSYAEGYNTTASGYYSHAEGYYATASGDYSHAEGNGTTASGYSSHAEGEDTTASSSSSHAEGEDTTASGRYSHAEGSSTTASGRYSHAEGFSTTASGKWQHVQGKYNIKDTNNKYSHIVGNGANSSSLSNAHTLDWSGNAWFAGEVKVGGTGQDDIAAKTLAKTEDIPTVDSTLTQSGQAADAAVVGNRLSALSEEIVTTAESKVSSHNTGTDTHSDIRLLIQDLTGRLNALADSDDTTLDQLSEIVAYIKSNRDLISAITTNKVSVTDIVNDLVTNVSNKPLSAAQGVALKALIDAITIPTALPNPNALTFTGAATGSYDGSEPLTVDIPSGGGSSGGAGKAKTQKLINITFTEPTASLTVTLEHNFHKLFLVWYCGGNGAARLVDADGKAVSGDIRILLDTTSYSWSERTIGQLNSDKTAWQTSAHLIEYTADLSTLLSAIEITIKTGTGGSILNRFGGTNAMLGTLGNNALAPTVGRTVNIVTSGGFFAATTRIVLVGEYYE